MYPNTFQEYQKAQQITHTLGAVHIWCQQKKRGPDFPFPPCCAQIRNQPSPLPPLVMKYQKLYHPPHPVVRHTTLLHSILSNKRQLWRIHFAYHPILDTRTSGLCPSVRPFVMLGPSPLYSETGWTGELWSKTNLLNGGNRFFLGQKFFFFKKFQNFWKKGIF